MYTQPSSCILDRGCTPKDTRCSGAVCNSHLARTENLNTAVDKHSSSQKNKSKYKSGEDGINDPVVFAK